MRDNRTTNNPADYEYRYTLATQVHDRESEGWEECGYAGHCVGIEPVFFVRRRTKPMEQKDCAHNYKHDAYRYLISGDKGFRTIKIYERFYCSKCLDIRVLLCCDALQDNSKIPDSALPLSDFEARSID